MSVALLDNCQTATSLSNVLLFHPGCMTILKTFLRTPVPSNLLAPVSTWTWSAAIKSLQCAAVTTKFGLTKVAPQNCANALSGCALIRSATWNGLSAGPATVPPTILGLIIDRRSVVVVFVVTSEIDLIFFSNTRNCTCSAIQFVLASLLLGGAAKVLLAKAIPVTTDRIAMEFLSLLSNIYGSPLNSLIKFNLTIFTNSYY